MTLWNILVMRSSSGDEHFELKLEQFRSEIDRLDAELIDILARRMELIDEIGHYKLENNITILQLDRWREISIDRISRAAGLGLSRHFIMQLLEIVHEESIRRQNDIMNHPSDNGTPSEVHLP
ncbi:MAG: hypothetical protein CVU06_05200 [Bacteroidetes bacterium HGW-Bacteroidetes-22]|nr:MAG: hypothetical protein CVU06_05200 [Bacteroidetes bacterium HGW-Bacteroidetes-22]